MQTAAVAFFLGWSLNLSRGVRPVGVVTTAPMAVIFQWDPILRRYSGVCPRLLQLRRTSGCSITADSSTKASFAPRFRAFSYPGPVLLYPSHDLLLISFVGQVLRFLKRIAEAAQYSGNRINVITNAKPTVDKLGDSAAVPEVIFKVRHLSSKLQILFQLAVLLRR